MSKSLLERFRYNFANFLLREEVPCSECAAIMNEAEEIIVRYLEIRSRIESQRKEELVDAYRIVSERKILDGLVRATEAAERRDPESYKSGT